MEPIEIRAVVYPDALLEECDRLRQLISSHLAEPGSRVKPGTAPIIMGDPEPGHFFPKAGLMPSDDVVETLRAIENDPLDSRPPHLSYLETASQTLNELHNQPERHSAEELFTDKRQVLRHCLALLDLIPGLLGEGEALKTVLWICGFQAAVNATGLAPISFSKTAMFRILNGCDPPPP